MCPVASVALDPGGGAGDAAVVICTQGGDKVTIQINAQGICPACGDIVWPEEEAD